ncbi:recombinase family protein [Vibrio vulnificus]
MAVIPYCRVSSGKQLSGLSLELQNDRVVLEQLATQYQTTVSDRVYQDAGVSSFKGANAKTGELARLLKDIESNLVVSGDVLVLRSLDRLSRQNLTASEVLYNTIINAGVFIHTTIDNHLYKKDCPMSSILATLALKTANEESSKKSHLTNRYAAHRIQQHQDGVRVDGYSYDVAIGRHPFWVHVDTTTKTVREHPVNWAIAKSLVKATLQGDGVGTVLRLARTHGLDITYSTVAKMFNSRSIYGVLEINHAGTDHVLEGYYPALVTEQEYYQIRAIKESATKVSNNQRKRVSILGGIQRLYCDCCGSVMVIARNVKQQVEYYRCSNRLVKCYPYLKQSDLDYVALLAIRAKLFVHQLNSTNTEDDLVLLGMETQLNELTTSYKKRQTLILDNPDLFDADFKLALSTQKSEIETLQVSIDQHKVESAKNDLNTDIDTSFLLGAIDVLDEHTKTLDSYINADCDLKTEIRGVVRDLVARITVDHRHMVTIQFKDSTVERYLIPRRRDGGKQLQRYCIKINTVTGDELVEMQSLFPEVAMVTATEETVSTLNPHLEALQEHQIPLIPIPTYKVVKDKVNEFYGLLTDGMYEWKRAVIMSVGATTTQWQEHKDDDVSIHGWTKVDVELITKYYTKRRTTIIYRGQLDLVHAAKTLGVIKVTIK